MGELRVQAGVMKNTQGVDLAAVDILREALECSRCAGRMAVSSRWEKQPAQGREE